MQHSVNGLNSGTLNHTLGNNSFVHNQNVTGTGNNWTHNGNLNHNANLNHSATGTITETGTTTETGTIIADRISSSTPSSASAWGWGLLLVIGWPWYYDYGYGYPLYGYNYYGYGYRGYNDGNNADGCRSARHRAAGDLASASNFADQGEIDFKAGKYQAAIRDWQHALVDDPKNGGIMMLMAQTLFALGQVSKRRPAPRRPPCKCCPRTSGAS